MKLKHLIYCKKTYIVKSLGHEIGRIEKNKTYYYYTRNDRENDREKYDIFVYYDENNTHAGHQGYTFYYDRHNNNAPIGVNIELISDYFYTQKEERKLKLDKINENR